eukprot:CAMPEP_0169138366 /NCGR_PEP_ID=MMETSP1015-20121227/42192_1 /TAXON_ID=342587 /ORGANISM="Karlodinium micrum, Strain CCMP2283" /LENGTH=184 /DNA_ID=CAMNT_0009203589 /DNA_START=18 /DNA_END=573 /DNA_ORIENTATION=+
MVEAGYVKQTWLNSYSANDQPQENAQKPTPRGYVKSSKATNEREREIERENLRLLSRMEEINRTGSGYHRSPRPASAPASGSKGVGSLRSSARAREQQRIDAENVRLLKRLQSSRPSIEQSQTYAAHPENRKKALLLENMCSAARHEKGLLPSLFAALAPPDSATAVPVAVARRLPMVGRAYPQ